MPDVAKPNRKILVGQVLASEYQRQDWVAKPEAGTALEEMLVPAYWASIARTLKPWDRIEVRPADATWYADLLVRAVEPFAVAVFVMRHEVFKRAETVRAEAESVPEGYEVKFRGRAGWCVLRIADNVILDERKDSRDAALLWLKGHLQALKPVS